MVAPSSLVDVSFVNKDAVLKKLCNALISAIADSADRNSYRRNMRV